MQHDVTISKVKCGRRKPKSVSLLFGDCLQRRRYCWQKRTNRNKASEVTSVWEQILTPFCLPILSSSFFHSRMTFFSTQLNRSRPSPFLRPVLILNIYKCWPRKFTWEHVSVKVCRIRAIHSLPILSYLKLTNNYPAV